MWISPGGQNKTVLCVDWGKKKKTRGSPGKSVERWVEGGNMGIDN